MTVLIIITSIIGYFIGGIFYFIFTLYLGKKLGWRFTYTYHDNALTSLGRCVVAAGSILWPIALICWICSSTIILGKLVYHHWIDK